MSNKYLKTDKKGVTARIWKGYTGEWFWQTEDKYGGNFNQTHSGKAKTEEEARKEATSFFCKTGHIKGNRCNVRKFK